MILLFLTYIFMIRFGFAFEYEEGLGDYNIGETEPQAQSVRESPVVEEGHPILRSNEVKMNPTEQDLPYPDFNSWLPTLRENIRKLVKEHGYQQSLSYIKDAVEKAEKDNNVLLHVNVKRKGTNSDLTRKKLGAWKYIRKPDYITSVNKKPASSEDVLLGLQRHIAYLVRTLGFKAAEPYIDLVVKETEKMTGLKLHVRVKKPKEEMASEMPATFSVK